MKTSTLLKLALVWSLVGTFLLLIVAELTEPEDMQISQADKYIGQTVVVTGNVTRAIYKDSVTFFDIANKSGEITTVIFEKLNQTVAEGDILQVTGRIDVYRGETEIIAQEIVTFS